MSQLFGPNGAIKNSPDGYVRQTPKFREMFGGRGGCTIAFLGVSWSMNDVAQCIVSARVRLGLGSCYSYVLTTVQRQHAGCFRGQTPIILEPTPGTVADNTQAVLPAYTYLSCIRAFFAQVGIWFSAPSRRMILLKALVSMPLIHSTTPPRYRTRKGRARRKHVVQNSIENVQV